MQPKLPPLPVRIVVAVLVISALAYFGFQSLAQNTDDSLSASGTIEAAIVNVSEMSAVTQVLAGEHGDENQPLFP